jgi:hypothetical protein|tara:strand:+ start:1853 stop:2248 length:396 start_codon:yes stop_codon:yes gene_type:complete
MAITPITLAVTMDEPAFCLVEVNLLTPDSQAHHRYRKISVVRDDAIAEYNEDLGPIDHFTTGQFRVPGGVVDENTGHIECLHTVGELVDIAEYYHAHIHTPEIEPDDLYEGFLRHEEARVNAWRRNDYSPR